MCQVLVLVNPLILPILMPASIKQVALQTIDLEARAVSGLAAYINDDFEKTVQIIMTIIENEKRIEDEEKLKA